MRFAVRRKHAVHQSCIYGNISVFTYSIKIYVYWTTSLFYYLEEKIIFNFPFSCVVSGYAFYLGLLLPSAIILTFNIVVFGPILKAILGSNQQKHVRCSEQESSEIKRRARYFCAISVLFGFTWSFGILAIGYMTIIFQWLFCIFNSTQGFFIFIFYTLRDQEMQKFFRKKKSETSTEEMFSKDFSKSSGPVTRL